MDYKDMNIFDIASVIVNCQMDDYRGISVHINGEEFNCFGCEVEDNQIYLQVTSERIKVSPIKSQGEENE